MLNSILNHYKNKAIFIQYLLILTLFALSDLNRFQNRKLSTSLSIVGWIILLLTIINWNFFTKKWKEFFILIASSFSVFTLFYLNTHLYEAGIDADNLYTFLGLKRFLLLDNPITFFGETISYPQFAMMFWNHLPGIFLFDSLGLIALHLGSIFFLSMATSIFIISTIKVSLPKKMFVTVLLAGCLSNRMLINSFDNIAYFLPSYCLGFIYLLFLHHKHHMRALHSSIFFVCFSLWDYYTGWIVTLPLFGLWIFYRRSEADLLGRYILRNNFIAITFFISVLSSLLNPQMLGRRLVDVTTSNSSVAAFFTKLKTNGAYLVGGYPAEWIRDFFINNPGKWHMLKNTAIFGEWLFIISVSLLLFSGLIFSSSKRHYIRTTFFFFTTLTLLLLTQHFLTDFEVKRDLILFFLLTFSSLNFIVDFYNQEKKNQLLSSVFAIALIVFNYFDCYSLRGHSRTSWSDHPRSAKVLESLRTDPTIKFDSPIYVTIERYFPTQLLYKDFLFKNNIQTISAEDFCENPDQFVTNLLSKYKNNFQLLVDWGMCHPVGHYQQRTSLGSNGIYLIKFSGEQQMNEMFERYVIKIALEL